MSDWTRKDNTWVNYINKDFHMRQHDWSFTNPDELYYSASWRYFANKQHHIFFETWREMNGWILAYPGGNTQGYPYRYDPEHKQFFRELFGEDKIYLPLRRDLEPLMKLYVEEWVKEHGN